MRMELTSVEADIIDRYRKGKSIVCHCTFGLGIKLSERPGERLVIEVNKEPMVYPQAFAIRKFMRETIRSWTRLLEQADQGRSQQKERDA